MRKALPLLFVALVLAGCGHTYSVSQTRAALAAEGIQTDAENSATLLKVAGSKSCSTQHRPFASLRLVVEELRFDVGSLPAVAYELQGGTIIVFCNRYDAARQAPLHMLLEQRAATYLSPYVTIHPRVIRRGNVVLVERNAPQPRLEAALARLH